MTYAQFGLVQAADVNTLLTGSANGTLNTGVASLNLVWSVGNQNKGYGQTAVATVTAGAPVAANTWVNMTSNTSSAALHQNSSILAVGGNVTSGSIVTYYSNIATNMTTIFNNRLNAVSQSTTSSNTATTVGTWTDRATFTHTVTFANGDAARYFFNSGGQLAITCSHPTGTGINLLLNNLASNVGTVVLSSPTSGTANIAGTSYNGVTRIGGGGTAPIITPNNGYYAWTTSNANVYYQTASTGPTDYLNTNINIFVRTNGTVGTNGDAGNIVTITTVWDEIPNGLTVASGSATTVTVRRPEVTNIANTWGAISVTGTVTVV